MAPANPGTKWVGVQNSCAGSPPSVSTSPSPWGITCPQTGLYGAFNVVNPDVPRGTGSFVTQRFVAKPCVGNPDYWFETGWAEVGWRADAQYIYTFARNPWDQGTWTFYDQYPITPGQRVYMMLARESSNNPVDWIAALWWNGAWQALLPLYYPPNSDASLPCAENAVEVVADTGEPHYSIPVIGIGDGTSSGVTIAHSNYEWQSWDLAVPTSRTEQSGDYGGAWRQYYYDGVVAQATVPFPVPPRVVSSSASPTTVSVGESVTFSVDWADPNPSIPVRALICKSNWVTAGECGGGRWAVRDFSTQSNNDVWVDWPGMNCVQHRVDGGASARWSWNFDNYSYVTGNEYSVIRSNNACAP